MKIRKKVRFRRYQFIDSIFEIEHLSKNAYILDLGGGPASFFSEYLLDKPNLVLLEINPVLAAKAKARFPHLQVIIANGEEMPFKKDAFDLTVCNSVIEHVQNPEYLGREIVRTGREYFVQTPDENFVLEPHSLIPIPFYRWIGNKKMRYILSKIFGGNFDYIESVTYLSEDQLRNIFGGAQICYERVLGMIKSFYIIKK